MSVPTGLLSLALSVGAEAPTPPPTPEEFTIYNVTPGISGFLAFFVLALAGWLLFRSLVRHVRKVDLAAADRERARTEAAARTEAEAAAPAEAHGEARPADDVPQASAATPGEATGAGAADERRGQATE